MKKEILSRVETSVEVCPIWSANAGKQMEKLVMECRVSNADIARISNTAQNINVKTGFATETFHKETFNLDAILKNQDVRAYTDRCGNSPLSRNHPTYDVVVMKGDERLIGAQLKVYKTAEKTANAFLDKSDGNYHYLDSDQNVAPTDQMHLGQEHLRRVELKNQKTRPGHSDAAKHVNERITDRIKTKDVESTPLSKRDAELIAKGDERGKAAHENVQNQYKNQSTIQQSLNAAKSAALITSVISGTINTISCLTMVQEGKMDVKEAAIYILKNTGIAAVDAAVKAAAGTAGASLAARALPELFQGSMLQSNLVGGAAAGAAVCVVDFVECLVLVYSGRMTMAELETRTGKNIFQTGAGVVGASIGGVIGAPAGPIGVFLGSMIGGMITSVAMTVAIDNHIEKPFREIISNTENIVATQQIMLYSIQYLEQAQAAFGNFRIGMYFSEEQFDKQMESVTNRRLSIQEKLKDI